MKESPEFHHLGLLVNEFEVSKRFYANLGYRLSTIIEDKVQRTNLMFCEHKKMPSVELVKPITNTSLQSYMLKHGEGIYHTCYSIKNDEQMETIFDKTRVICIQEKRPAILFGMQEVSFYFVRGVGIIEILHERK